MFNFLFLGQRFSFLQQIMKKPKRTLLNRYCICRWQHKKKTKIKISENSVNSQVEQVNVLRRQVARKKTKSCQLSLRMPPQYGTETFSLEHSNKIAKHCQFWPKMICFSLLNKLCGMWKRWHYFETLLLLGLLFFE